MDLVLGKNEIRKRILKVMDQTGIENITELKHLILHVGEQEPRNKDIGDAVGELLKAGLLKLPDPDSPIIQSTKKTKEALVKEGT